MAPRIIIFVAILLLIAVAVAVMFLKAKLAAKSTPGKPDVYYLKKSLFTPAERSFLGVLESLNYDGITVASKVRLADVFGIKEGLARGDRQRALNRISAKHVDFLLLKESDGAPLLGIELDDSSHEEEDRIARDAFVDSVFTSASLPILHIAVKAAYDPKQIHRQIELALDGK